MSRSTKRSLALAGFCLIAACGPKGGGASSGQATAAPPASGADVQLSFADLPRPRAGLWRTTLDNGHGRLVTDDHCLSGKAPNIGREARFGHGPSGCGQVSVRRTLLGAIVMDMTCGASGLTMTSHTVATGDFQTTMTSDSKMTLSAGRMATRTLTFHSEAHWVGPCPAGQRASDEPQRAAG
jgi:hypothetical protein